MKLLLRATLIALAGLLCVRAWCGPGNVPVPVGNLMQGPVNGGGNPITNVVLPISGSAVTTNADKSLTINGGGGSITNIPGPSNSIVVLSNGNAVGAVNISGVSVDIGTLKQVSSGQPLQINNALYWGAVPNAATIDNATLQGWLNYIVTNSLWGYLPPGSNGLPYLITTNLVAPQGGYYNNWGIYGGGQILCISNNTPILDLGGYNHTQVVFNNVSFCYENPQTNAATQSNSVAIYLSSDGIPQNQTANHAFFHLSNLNFTNCFLALKQQTNECFFQSTIDDWHIVEGYGGIDLSRCASGQGDLTVDEVYGTGPFTGDYLLKIGQANTCDIRHLQLNNATNFGLSLTMNGSAVAYRDPHGENITFTLTNRALMVFSNTGGSWLVERPIFSSLTFGQAGGYGTNWLIYDASPGYNGSTPGQIDGMVTGMFLQASVASNNTWVVGSQGIPIVAQLTNGFQNNTGFAGFGYGNVTIKPYFANNVWNYTAPLLAPSVTATNTVQAYQFVATNYNGGSMAYPTILGQGAENSQLSIGHSHNGTNDFLFLMSQYGVGIYDNVRFYTLLNVQSNGPTTISNMNGSAGITLQSKSGSSGTITGADGGAADFELFFGPGEVFSIYDNHSSFSPLALGAGGVTANAGLTVSGTNNITNNLAAGVSAGANITLSGGANGPLTISSSAGGGSTFPFNANQFSGSGGTTNLVSGLHTTNIDLSGTPTNDAGSRVLFATDGTAITNAITLPTNNLAGALVAGANITFSGGSSGPLTINSSASGGASFSFNANQFAGSATTTNISSGAQLTNTSLQGSPGANTLVVTNKLTNSILTVSEPVVTASDDSLASVSYATFASSLLTTLDNDFIAVNNGNGTNLTIYTNFTFSGSAGSNDMYWTGVQWVDSWAGWSVTETPNSRSSFFFYPPVGNEITNVVSSNGITVTTWSVGTNTQSIYGWTNVVSGVVTGSWSAANASLSVMTNITAGGNLSATNSTGTNNFSGSGQTNTWNGTNGVVLSPTGSSIPGALTIGGSATLPALTTINTLAWPANAAGVLTNTGSALSWVAVGGGSGSQSPWTASENASGYGLTQLNTISLSNSVGTNTVSASGNTNLNTGVVTMLQGTNSIMSVSNLVATNVTASSLQVPSATGTNNIGGSGSTNTVNGTNLNSFAVTGSLIPGQLIIGTNVSTNINLEGGTFQVNNTNAPSGEFLSAIDNNGHVAFRAASGSGTVTSVAVAADAAGVISSWSGSPITTSGTLTPTFDSTIQLLNTNNGVNLTNLQSTNLVFTWATNALTTNQAQFNGGNSTNLQLSFVTNIYYCVCSNNICFTNLQGLSGGLNYVDVFLRNTNTATTFWVSWYDGKGTITNGTSPILNQPLTNGWPLTNSLGYYHFHCTLVGTNYETNAVWEVSNPSQ